MDKYESFGTSSYSVGNCGDRSMELRDLYALSAENSAKYADNEAGKQQEFRLVETTRSFRSRSSSDRQWVSYRSTLSSMHY